jgi:putative DNA primase/helicase
MTLELIGDGVATVLSASAAANHSGVAALSNTNLPTVAKVMRECYPAATLVVLADLVQDTGEPEHCVVEAAQAMDGRLDKPEFGTDRPLEMKDFNDLHRARGLEVVKICIDAAVKPAGDAVASASEPAKGEHPPSGKSAPADGSGEKTFLPSFFGGTGGTGDYPGEDSRPCYRIYGDWRDDGKRSRRWHSGIR